MSKRRGSKGQRRHAAARRRAQYTPGSRSQGSSRSLSSAPPVRPATPLAVTPGGRSAETPSVNTPRGAEAGTPYVFNRFSSTTPSFNTPGGHTVPSVDTLSGAEAGTPYIFNPLAPAMSSLNTPAVDPYADFLDDEDGLRVLPAGLVPAPRPAPAQRVPDITFGTGIFDEVTRMSDEWGREAATRQHLFFAPAPLFGGTVGVEDAAPEYAAPSAQAPVRTTTAPHISPARAPFLVHPPLCESRPPFGDPTPYLRHERRPAPDRRAPARPATEPTLESSGVERSNLGPAILRDIAPARFPLETYSLPLTFDEIEKMRIDFDCRTHSANIVDCGWCGEKVVVKRACLTKQGLLSRLDDLNSKLAESDGVSREELLREKRRIIRRRVALERAAPDVAEFLGWRAFSSAELPPDARPIEERLSTVTLDERRRADESDSDNDSEFESYLDDDAIPYEYELHRDTNEIPLSSKRLVPLCHPGLRFDGDRRGHPNTLYNERAPQGYIKRLVIARAAGGPCIEVCPKCHAAVVERGDGSSIWQVGYDWGWIPDIMKRLTPIEQEAIARIHPFMRIIRIICQSGGVARSYRGNSISFPQSAREAASGMIPVSDAFANPETRPISDPFENIKLHIQFVGPKGLKTTVGGEFVDQLVPVRPDIILDVLQWLQISAPDYFANINFGSATDVVYAFERLKRRLLQEAVEDTLGQRPPAPTNNAPANTNPGRRAANNDDDDTPSTTNNATPPASRNLAANNATMNNNNTNNTAETSTPNRRPRTANNNDDDNDTPSTNNNTTPSTSGTHNLNHNNNKAKAARNRTPNGASNNLNNNSQPDNNNAPNTPNANNNATPNNNNTNNSNPQPSNSAPAAGQPFVQHEAAEQAEQQLPGTLVMETSVVADDMDIRVAEARASDMRAVLRLVQGAKPVNEFQNNNDIFNLSFPHLFPTGGFPCNNFPSPKMLRHFMRYYDGRFDNDSFLFLLNNQRVRHGALRNNARAPRELKDQVADMIADGAAYAASLASINAKRAGNQALTEEENAINELTRRSVQVSYSRVAFSPAEMPLGRWRVLSKTRSRGNPTFFITFSPSVVDNNLGIRMVLNSVDGRDVDAISEESHSYTFRSSRVFASPTRAAMFYEEFKAAVFEEIFKIKRSNEGGWETTGEMGLFGIVEDMFAATECQGRSLLHCHSLWWVKETPEHLSDDIKKGNFEKVFAFVDSNLQATMPDDFFAEREQLWADFAHVPCTWLSGKPAEEMTIEERVAEMKAVLARAAMHYEHRPTCWKGRAPLNEAVMRQCRLFFPRPTADDTEVRVLVLAPGINERMVRGTHYFVDNARASAMAVCPHLPGCDCPDKFIHQQIVPMVIVPKRPMGFGTATSSDGTKTVTLGRNQLFTETNLELAAMLKCNTNVSIIDGVAGAGSTIGYLTNYLTKGGETMEVPSRAFIIHWHAYRDRVAEDELLQTLALIAPDSARAPIPVTVAVAYPDGHAPANNNNAQANAIPANTPAPNTPWSAGGRTRTENDAMAVIAMAKGHNVEVPATQAALALLGGKRFEQCGSQVGLPAIAYLKQQVGEAELDNMAAALMAADVGNPPPDNAAVWAVDGDMEDAAEFNIHDDEDEGEFELFQDPQVGGLVIRDQLEDYIHRPAFYEDLGLYEFVSCYKTVNWSPEAPIPEGCHQFLPSHPRANSMLVKTAPSFATPAFVGGPPPNLPRETSKTAKAYRLRARWSIFWALVLLPNRGFNNVVRNVGEYRAFKAMLNGWANGADDGGVSTYNVSRAQLVHRCTFSSATTKVVRQLLASHRAINADVIDPRARGAVPQAQGGGDPQAGEVDDGNGETNELEEVMSEVMRAIMVAPKRSEDVADMMSALFVVPESLRNEPCGLSSHDVLPNNDAYKQLEAQHKGITSFKGDLGELAQAAAPDNEHVDDQFNSAVPTAGGIIANNTANTNGGDPEKCDEFALMNENQKKVFKLIFNSCAFSRPVTDNQPIYWLEGAAGTGKTFVMRALLRNVRLLLGADCAAVACAFQGVAAANIELGAFTIHSLLGLKPMAKNYTANLAVVKRNLGRTRLLVIDEISMVPAKMFDSLDTALRALSIDKQHLPFGGLIVVCVGDFLQIPPVAATGLAKAAFDNKQSLWRNVVRMPLTQLMRAAECPRQMARLGLLRNRLRTTAGTVGSIKTLEAADFAKDSNWGLPTTLHHTNDARVQAGGVLLRNHASVAGRVVYRWRLEVPVLDRNGCDDAFRALVYAQFPELMFECFAGMRAMLTDNICTQLGLANGTIGRVFRIHFASDPLVGMADPPPPIVALAPGNEPKCIELAFPAPQRADIISLIERLGFGTIYPDVHQPTWVVPIFPDKTLDAVEIGMGKKLVPKGFPIVQAYSLTFHKSQGLTFRNVAIDFSKKERASRDPSGGERGLTFDMIYVAVSRAPSDDDVRLLPCPPGTSNDSSIGKAAQDWVQSYLNKSLWVRRGGGSYGSKRSVYEIPRVAPKETAARKKREDEREAQELAAIEEKHSAVFWASKQASICRLYADEIGGDELKDIAAFAAWQASVATSLSSREGGVTPALRTAVCHVAACAVDVILGTLASTVFFPTMSESRLSRVGPPEPRDLSADNLTRYKMFWAMRFARSLVLPSSALYASLSYPNELSGEVIANACNQAVADFRADNPPPPVPRRRPSQTSSAARSASPTENAESHNGPRNGRASPQRHDPYAWLFADSHALVRPEDVAFRPMPMPAHLLEPSNLDGDALMAVGLSVDSVSPLRASVDASDALNNDGSTLFAAVPVRGAMVDDDAEYRDALTGALVPVLANRARRDALMAAQRRSQTNAGDDDVVYEYSADSDDGEYPYCGGSVDSESDE